MAALLAALAVVLGAFGAHALKDLLTETGRTEVWNTAVFYHLIHALALWAASQLEGVSGGRLRMLAVCWGGGVLLFSGSLYALSLGGSGWLGPVTPIGGLLFIIGWLCAMGGRSKVER